MSLRADGTGWQKHWDRGVTFPTQEQSRGESFGSGELLWEERDRLNDR